MNGNRLSMLRLLKPLSGEVALATSLVLGMAFPWGLVALPYEMRVAGVAVMMCGGLWVAARTLWKRSAVTRLWIGVWWTIVAFASLWVALASFSAEVSKFSWIPLTALGMAAILSVLIASLAGHWRKLPWKPPGWFAVAATILYGISAIGAAPARRYERPRNMRAISELAAPLSLRECHEWVVNHIERRRAPFTDTALDTLNRGYATCGGMANLLHKMIDAKGIPARIVHFASGQSIHTLVEYHDPSVGGWVLADPDKQLWGMDWNAVSARQAVLDSEPTVPDAWRNFNRLYIYVEGRGYRRVTAGNIDDFY